MTDIYYFSKKWLMLLVWGKQGLSRENCRLRDLLGIITLSRVFCDRTHISTMWATKSHHFPNPRICVATGGRHRWLSQAYMEYSARKRHRGHLAAFTLLVSHSTACVWPFTGDSLPHLDSTTRQRAIVPAVLCPTDALRLIRSMSLFLLTLIFFLDHRSLNQHIL